MNKKRFLFIGTIGLESTPAAKLRQPTLLLQVQYTMQIIFILQERLSSLRKLHLELGIGQYATPLALFIPDQWWSIVQKRTFIL